jgi:hypothetical protein
MVDRRIHHWPSGPAGRDPESGSFPIRQTPGKSSRMDPPDPGIRRVRGWNPGGKGAFISDFTPLMRIPAASPDPIKRGRGGLRPGPIGRGSGPAECETRTDKSLSHASPPRRDPRRDRWAPVDGNPAASSSRPLNPGWTDGPPARAVRELPTKSCGLRRGPDRRPRLSPAVGRGRPDGRDHIQSHSVHVQSTFSPRMWPRIVHVRGSTYGVPHARGHGGIYGVQRRMVETM